MSLHSDLELSAVVSLLRTHRISCQVVHALAQVVNALKAVSRAAAPQNELQSLRNRAVKWPRSSFFFCQRCSSFVRSSSQAAPLFVHCVAAGRHPSSRRRVSAARRWPMDGRRWIPPHLFRLHLLLSWILMCHVCACLKPRSGRCCRW